jgi:hypothetical protein
VTVRDEMGHQFLVDIHIASVANAVAWWNHASNARSKPYAQRVALT